MFLYWHQFPISQQSLHNNNMDVESHATVDHTRYWPASNQWLRRTEGHQAPRETGDCRKLLLNVDYLGAICPIGILSFVDSLRKLCHVVDACFGSDLRYDFQEKIAEFETSFLDLGIGITSKVHILLRHVPEFYWRHEKALGRFSEQASESVHVALKEFWKKRKVSDLSNPRYEQSLRHTVVEFNSKHL